MEAKSIAIVHGLMHTARRWERLAGCFADAVSLQLPAGYKVDDIAREMAPELAGYDILIGHSMGGLVIYRAITQFGAPKPQAAFFVATPFRGLRVPGGLSPLVRIPKSREMIRLFSLLTVTHSEAVDDIMLDDVMSQDFTAAARLLKELCGYRLEVGAIPGVDCYNIIAGRDHVCRPAWMEGAGNYRFARSGHTIPLEYEEQFVRLVKHLAKTR